MQYKIFDNSLYARFDKGDEVLGGIVEICQKENIAVASFAGIGGCGEITVGTYNLEKHDYLTKSMTGMFEMLSVNGNVTLNQDNELFAHAHAMFSYIGDDNQIQLIGGHLKKAVINLTGEIVITPVKNAKIIRQRNDAVGINTWKF